MKRIIAKLSAVMLIATVVLSVALATVGNIEKTLLYDDIKITLRGEEIKPCDVNGNYIEPFIIEGTTYLPVRGIANALGLSVGWDDFARTVRLNDPLKKTELLHDVRKMKLSFIGYEYTDEGDLKVRFQADNKNLDDMTVDIHTASVNGCMLEGGFKGVTMSGKKEYVDAVIKAEELEKHNITYVKEIEFTVYIVDDKIGEIMVENSVVTITPDGVTTGERKAAEREPYTGDATYNDFVEFVKQNGEPDDDGIYKIPYIFQVMKKAEDDPTLFVISLNYNEKGLALDIMMNREDEGGAHRSTFLTVTLKDNADFYDFEGHMMNDFGIIIGQIPADDTMYDPEKWSMGNIIVKGGYAGYAGHAGYVGSIDTKATGPIKQYMATVFSEMLEFVSDYGDDLFQNHGSDLTFKFFAI